MIMVFLYNLIFLAFALVSFPFFLTRLKQAEDPTRLLLNRRGRFSSAWLADLDGREVIWIHAVSVGEVLGVSHFIREAEKRFPNYQFVLSTTTPTGFRMAEQLKLPRTPVFYAPFDLSLFTERAVRTLRPRLLLLMETELWPNLISSVRRSGAAIGLINGRLSPRSFKGYIWVRSLLKPLLSSFSFLAVQTATDRDRFVALGAPKERVRETGSLKFDTGDVSLAGRDEVRAHLGVRQDQQIFLAGSTHAGEEEIVLRTFKKLKKDFPKLLLILAPRHVNRAAQIAEQSRALGFDTVLASAKDRFTSVLVLDVMGELKTLYAAADVVFMGGSLVRHGGQNPAEAIRFRHGIISGPHVFNFQNVFERLWKENGARVVRDGAELFDAASDWLGHDDRRTQAAARATAVLSELSGATERHLKEMETCLNALDKNGLVSEKRPKTFRDRLSGLSSGYVSLVSGQVSGFWTRPARWALELLSIFYRGAVIVRNGLYDKRILNIHTLPIPVVSVGNITWGGTGKTPLVDYISRYYRGKNSRVLILTRGYGRDETEQFRRHEPGAVLAIGGDRYRTAGEVLTKTACDVAILDDGFQHRRLHRSLDIVAVHAAHPFGSGRLIPAGILREPLSSLRRANLAIITHANLVTAEALSALKTTLAKYGLREDAIIEAVHEPLYFYRASSGKQVSIAALSDKQALVFSGIGRPDSFEDTLKHAGVRLHRSVRFTDHHSFSLGELTDVKEHARGADEVITTEKDFLRAPNLIKDTIDPLILKIGIRITRGEDIFHARLARLLDR